MKRQAEMAHPMDEWWAAQAGNQHVPIHPNPGWWDEQPTAVGV
jgi:hypothetical protein